MFYLCCYGRRFWLMTAAFAGIVICILPHHLFAQSAPTSSPSSEDIFDSANAAVIPFDYNPLTSGGMIVHVSINGHNALPFIVDTGFNLPIVFSQKAAQELGIKSDGKSETIPGTSTKIYEGGAEQAVLTGTSSAKGFTINFSNVYFGNIDPLMRGTSSGEIAGFIGGPLLASLAVRINFATHRMFWSTRPHVPLNMPGATRIPLDEQAGIYYVSDPINGQLSNRLILDTGSDISLLASAAVLAAHPSVMLAGPREGVAGESTSEIYLVPHIRIGSINIANVFVGIVPLPTDGILGRDILTRFTVTLDFPNKQMLLEPRSTIDFSDGYSGAVVENRDQNCYINHVYGGSPAATAGLKPGDMILDVNGQSPKALQNILAQNLLDGYAQIKECVTLARPDGKFYRIILVPGSEAKPAYFDKVGIRFSRVLKSGKTYVSGILCSSPGWYVGIRAGDYLLEIDKMKVETMAMRQIEALLQKPVLTLTLTILHSGANMPQTVTFSTVGPSATAPVTPADERGRP